MDEKKENFWKELLKLVILSLVIVIPFRLFIAQPFIVEGASMDPTFHTGDYLIVDELSYRFQNPDRGSVVIFKYPVDPRKKFIKRIIGLPEETVSLDKGVVTIKNAEYPEGFVLDEPYVEEKKDETVNFIIGKNEYFVMGDNRLWSSDSRVWGPVPRANIIGRPVIQFLPPDLFPGEFSFDLKESNKQSDAQI